MAPQSSTHNHIQLIESSETSTPDFITVPDYNIKINDAESIKKSTDIIMNNIIEVKMHQTIDSDNKTSNKCNMCQTKYSNINFIIDNEINICSICQKKWAHMRVHHHSKINNGDRNLEFQQNLLSQIIKEHRLADDVNIISINNNFQEKIGSVNIPPLIITKSSDVQTHEYNSLYARKFQCCYCSLAFVKIQSLIIHCRRNHQRKFSECELKGIVERAEDKSKPYSIASVIRKARTC